MQGTDYTTWIAVPDNQFAIDEGSSLISRYAFNKKSSKSFCSSCGTAVCGVNEKHFPEHKVVPLGAIENYSDEIKPQVQVYTEDKAPWVQIHDDVPVYKG